MAATDAGTDFAGTARWLAAAARARGLDAPGFRTPPRQAGCNRTIRRYSDGTALVAVRVKGRLWDDVVDDPVGGVLTVNDLHGARAAALRYAIWCDLTDALSSHTSAA